ncbi:MAG: NAD-dependent epimerase/dehydratase family protein [Ignavibacteria bacterium]|nr:NAD-dependent epimerase/dehydratase family protein [Ignavibacteria bacterium]
MKILVTGATGFVGSHVVDKFLAEGHDVTFIARSTSNLRWLKDTAATQVEGSLHDLDSMKEAVDGVDIIIHVAAAVAGRNEAELEKNNVLATKNLLDAVRAYNPGLKRFVHISTQAVVGPSSSAEYPADEETPCHPLTGYGRTKLKAEHLVNEAGKEFPITIIRPPAVFGPRDAAILTVFQTIAKGIAPLIGFDEKRVSLIHVSDLVQGIFLAATSEKAKGETYFISSEVTYTWPEVTNLMAAALGKRRVLTVKVPHVLIMGIAGVVGFFGNMTKKPPVLNYEKGIDITQSFWTASSEKARRDLGYRQKMNIANGIVDTVQWYKKNKWL